METRAADSLRTEAWLLMGLTGSVSGALRLEGGRLSFVSSTGGIAGIPFLLGRQLRTLEKALRRPGLAKELKRWKDAVVEVFDVPLERVEQARFPRAYLGNGATLTVGGVPLRFSFVKPQNARPPMAEGRLAGVLDLREGRRVGQAWEEALAAAGVKEGS